MLGTPCWFVSLPAVIVHGTHDLLNIAFSYIESSLVRCLEPYKHHSPVADLLLLLPAGSMPVRVSPSKTPVRPDPRHDDTPVPRRSSA